MALFHLHVTQVKRSAGQSVVTSAAYRAGEKLYSEYYGEVSDYTHKGGVVCTDILLPPQAPNQYQDRATLWNAVEKAERGKKAQLAYSFDIALQNEFSLEENIALARQFVSEQLVGRGMIADFAIHQPDKEDGGIPNPHFHVLCPIRPIEPDGKWGCKQRRRYRLDEDGNRIMGEDGKPLFDAVPTTDWGSPETLEHWREAWAAMAEHGKGNILNGHHAFLGGAFHGLTFAAEIASLVIEPLLCQHAHAVCHRPAGQKILQIVGADHGGHAFVLIYENTAYLVCHVSFLLVFWVWGIFPIIPKPYSMG